MLTYMHFSTITALCSQQSWTYIWHRHNSATTSFAIPLSTKLASWETWKRPQRF